MGINDELNDELMKKMFNAIRDAEIRNIKTQINDDKKMATILEDYVSKKVREEMRKNED